MDGSAAVTSDGWLERIERDAMALGSPLFYLLVIGRGLVGPFWDLVVPLVVLGLAMTAGHRWLSSTDLYLSRALVLAVLITNHYEDVAFGVFAAAAFGFMLFASLDLGTERRAVRRGVLAGAGAAIVGLGLALPYR